MNRSRLAWVAGILFTMASATVMAEMAAQMPPGHAGMQMPAGHAGMNTMPAAHPKADKKVDSTKAAINHDEIRAMVSAFPIIEKLSVAAKKCQASVKDENYATPACAAFQKEHTASEPALKAALGQVEHLIGGGSESGMLGHAEMHLLTAFMQHYQKFNDQKSKIKQGQ
ncbi:hypothetical protein [Magnetococcus sp. PR-3]|uniref:hypothetical protein n=1 Tax=Magnetococcus sp. PR-3 TaxID=3120355 RepID=UPI002FCE1769